MVYICGTECSPARPGQARPVSPVPLQCQWATCPYFHRLVLVNAEKCVVSRAGATVLVSWGVSLVMEGWAVMLE